MFRLAPARMFGANAMTRKMMRHHLPAVSLSVYHMQLWLGSAHGVSHACRPAPWHCIGDIYNSVSCVSSGTSSMVAVKSNFCPVGAQLFMVPTCSNVFQRVPRRSMALLFSLFASWTTAPHYLYIEAPWTSFKTRGPWISSLLKRPQVVATSADSRFMGSG